MDRAPTLQAIEIRGSKQRGLRRRHGRRKIRRPPAAPSLCGRESVLGRWRKCRTRQSRYPRYNGCKGGCDGRKGHAEAEKGRRGEASAVMCGRDDVVRRYWGG